MLSVVAAPCTDGSGIAIAFGMDEASEEEHIGQRQAPSPQVESFQAHGWSGSRAYTHVTGTDGDDRARARACAPARNVTLTAATSVYGLPPSLNLYSRHLWLFSVLRLPFILSSPVLLIQPRVYAHLPSLQ